MTQGDLQFKPVDFNQNHKGKMLMAYGPPGSGKSTLAAALARSVEDTNNSHAVVIDFEIGIRDALRFSGCKKAELYDLSDPNAELGRNLPRFLRSLRDRPDVKLVVLDTLSEMCWSLLRGICGTKQATLQMYGERKRQLKEILLELRNLTKTGKHVLVLTHQTVGEVEGLPGYYAPECPKNDRADVVGQFDFVGRVLTATKGNADQLKLEPGQRYLDYRQDPQQVSKCRFCHTIGSPNKGAAHPYILIRDLVDVRKFYSLLNK